MAERRDFISGEIESDITGIKKFLLFHGFTDVSYEVLDTIAKLIASGINDENSDPSKNYTALKTGSSDWRTMRSKLAYYIKKNHERVRNSIIAKHDHDIGDYSGVKNFIEQMVIVYCVFERV